MSVPVSANPPFPATVHEQLHVSLYQVETTSYQTLRVVDMERSHWIVSHVLRGAVETHCQGEAARVKSGDVMIHPPDLPFSEYAVGAGTHQWMAFDLVVSPHVDLFHLHPVPLVVSLVSVPVFTHTFDLLSQVWAQPASPLRDLRAFGLTVELLSLVLDSWQAAGSVVRAPALQSTRARFLPILLYMRDHLDQKLSRNDLAEQACLHPGYFDRAFRATYGTPPMRMLRNLRLRRAQLLLETTNETLHSIALACGLGDATHLSRVFRERFGKTPGQHRESVKTTREGYIRPL